VEAAAAAETPNIASKKELSSDAVGGAVIGSLTSFILLSVVLCYCCHRDRSSAAWISGPSSRSTSRPRHHRGRPSGGTPVGLVYRHLPPSHAYPSGLQDVQLENTPEPPPQPIQQPPATAPRPRAPITCSNSNNSPGDVESSPSEGTVPFLPLSPVQPPSPIAPPLRRTTFPVPHDAPIRLEQPRFNAGQTANLVIPLQRLSRTATAPLAYHPTTHTAQQNYQAVASPPVPQSGEENGEGGAPRFSWQPPEPPPPLVTTSRPGSLHSVNHFYP
jgi:hypothetical protein